MRLLFAGKYMSNYADILAELSEATPVFRRYARALGAGVGLVVADGLVHSALQGLGARLRALWQMCGFFLGWLDQPGRGRSIFNGNALLR